jgi:tetrahydromethanopterin S-methyltransferase subunit D
MSDNFSRYETKLESPGFDAFSITKSDADDLDIATRGLYIGTEGDGTLKVTMVSGSVVTFVGIKSGAVYPFRVKKVFSTGTGVSNIIGIT